MFQKTKLNANGFTLVELLVVIFIIGLLSAVLVPAVFGAHQRSLAKACKAEIQQLEQALTLYEVDYRDFPPSSLQDLGLKVSNKINEGCESLVLTLSSRRNEMSYFSFREDRLENTDADRAPVTAQKLTNSVFTTNELFELIDPFGNPYIYFHANDLDATCVQKYIIGGERRDIKPNLTQDKLGLIRGAGRYQLHSLGADFDSELDDIWSD